MVSVLQGTIMRADGANRRFLFVTLFKQPSNLLLGVPGPHIEFTIVALVDRQILTQLSVFRRKRLVLGCESRRVFPTSMTIGKPRDGFFCGSIVFSPHATKCYPGPAA
jgi:hypothetical protein